jgi:surface antigen
LNPPANFWVIKFFRQGQLSLRQTSRHRRSVAIGIATITLVVVAVIVLVVLANSSSVSAAANPVDQVSSADIALTVAQVSNLPESTAISNQAQSAAADSTTTADTDNVVTKPQVMGDTLKSNADIQTYTSVAGDTVTSLAAKFGVTSDSIRWSNNLNSDNLNAGSKLLIPPVNGIVYTVQAGDTSASLATRFHSNTAKIVAYNDAEISGLQAGERIIIPDGVESAQTTAADITGAPSAAGSSTTSFPWGSSPIYGYNGYDYGYCTWYVATQIAVPANWGNASTWAYYAALSGWNVSKTPTVGAIGQIGGRVAAGEGHVAVVDAVSPDGTQIQYRDMNGLAGWGRVGYSGWTSSSFFDNYITR